MIEKDDDNDVPYYSKHKDLGESYSLQNDISPFYSKKNPNVDNININPSFNFENSDSSFKINKTATSILNLNESNKKFEYESVPADNNMQFNGNNILNHCFYLNQPEDGKYYEFKRVFLKDAEKDYLLPKNSTLISKVLDFIFNW